MRKLNFQLRRPSCTLWKLTDDLRLKIFSQIKCFKSFERLDNLEGDYEMFSRLLSKMLNCLCVYIAAIYEFSMCIDYIPLILVCLESPPPHWALMWHLTRRGLCNCLIPDYARRCRTSTLIMVPINFWRNSDPF